MQKKLIYCIASVVIVMIAMAYWPVLHASFVWDDWPGFRDTPWLTQGDQWKHYIWRDFNSWTFYFRPLVVAFFTLQVRLFDSAPGPMHAVSLALHLIVTLLVGLLSWRCGKAVTSDIKRLTWVTAGCMLLYGLHPALIEPVAWVGCQGEFIATMMVLLGLLATAYVRSDTTRAVAITTIFFLATLTKESAVIFPLLIVIFDWALFARKQGEGTLAAIRTLLRRNWRAYVGMLFAGFAYLAVRHWALGAVVYPFGGNSDSLLARFQQTCFLYLRYWKMIFWPIAGMSPIHPVDTRQFGLVTLWSLLTVAVALAIVVTGFYSAIKRRSPLGCIVMAATVALLPVLHIASVDFERSLYHERYAMTALAVICSMLPLLRFPNITAARSMQQRLTLPLLSIALLFWLTFAIVDIRVIVPLWSNDTNLWQWALTTHPHSAQAKGILLSAYVRNKDYGAARELGDRLMADPTPCVNCMLSIAELAVDQRDPARAAIALERVRQSPLLTTHKETLRMYYVTTGQMLILQGQLDDAEGVLRTAVSLDPSDPKSRSVLATAIALKGKQFQSPQ